MNLSLLAQTAVSQSDTLGEYAVSASPGFLHSISQGPFGIVLIFMTIGFFATVIVTVVSVCRSYTNLKLVKTHHKHVTELLQAGYSVDDIERLTGGGRGFGKKVKKLGRAAMNRLNTAAVKSSKTGKPVPPVKQHV